ncbi:NOL7 protein, partial [Bucorvus abyssinicus]|nr:NOL7 protein [Bucorvus abyssinicus]
MVQRLKAAAGAERRPPAALLGPASSEDEADEAPEEVSFGTAREAAATERKLVGEAARRHRELLKEKRRRRQELFTEQKVRRPLQARGGRAAIPRPANPALSTPAEAEAAPRGRAAGAGRRAARTVRGEVGWVTKSTGNYTAVCLKEQSITGLHQQLARDFIKAQLYGPGTNRAQANDYFSLENKKNPVKKAAVQFVDKSWGEYKR